MKFLSLFAGIGARGRGRVERRGGRVAERDVREPLAGVLGGLGCVVHRSSSLLLEA